MKKLTSLFVVLMLACITVNADVLFQETFSTRRGSTYVEKIRIVPKTGDPYDAWPYPSQWFTGYDNNKEGDDHKVIEGNQYDIDYATVESYGTSIRNKKLNESTDNTVGLYFGANKAADKMYAKFVSKVSVPVPEGAFLKFEICSPEADGGNLSTMQIKVNDDMVNVPVTELKAKAITSEVAISLPAGQIDSIKFAFDNVPSQKFISRVWVDTQAPQAIENVAAAAAKATKVVENGQLYIIRNGVKYNAAGAIVK